MACFYCIEVVRDPFGHVVLVHRCGRIGAKGRNRLHEHQDKWRALAAPAALEARKRAAAIMSHAHYAGPELPRATRKPTSSIVKVGWLRRRLVARHPRSGSAQPPPRKTR